VASVKDLIFSDRGDVGAAITWIEAVVTIGYMGFIFLIFGEMESAIFDITASQIPITATTRVFARLVFRVGFPILVLITTGLFVMARRAKRTSVVV
jgi:hypothetical protein